MSKHNPLPRTAGITKQPGYKLKKAKPQWVPPVMMSNFADTAIARAVASVLPMLPDLCYCAQCILADPSRVKAWFDNRRVHFPIPTIKSTDYIQGRIVLLKPRSVGWSTIAFDTLAKRQGMQHLVRPD